IDGARDLLERVLRLAPSLLAPSSQAFRAADFEPGATALGLAELVALGVALVHALLKAFRHRRLVRAVVARAARASSGELGQRREAVWAVHLHSTTASANSCTSTSPASASVLTWAMMSRRACCTRLIGTGPERRITSSKPCACRRGIVCRMASRTAGSAPLSA